MGTPVRAKKNLGQHFLRSSATAKDIADTLPSVCENCLEIGPGMGILTNHLLDKNINLKVIEIDGESIDYLLINQVISPAQCIKGFPPKNSFIGNLRKSPFIHCAGEIT